MITLAIFLAVVMTEVGFKRVIDQDRQSWRSLFSTFSQGVTAVRQNRTLILILVAGVVVGAFSEGFDRLSTAHLLKDFHFPEVAGLQPVVWFGAMAALSTLLAIPGMRFAERQVDTDNHQSIARWLTLLTALVSLAVMLFALTNFFWVAICMFVITAPLREISYPLRVAWLNQHLDSNVRATVISMNGQADAMGQIGGGPIVGLIGKEYSISIAIFISGLLLAPAIWIYHKLADHPGQ